MALYVVEFKVVWPKRLEDSPECYLPCGDSFSYFCKWVGEMIEAQKARVADRLREILEDFARGSRNALTWARAGTANAMTRTSRLPEREGVMMSVQGKLKKAGRESASARRNGGGSGKGDVPDGRDKPFPKEILEEAKRIAKGYTISVRELEGHGYVGCPIELPTIEGYGDTPQTCYESTRDAVEFAVATMLERGEVPPLPAAAEQRTAQVNVKLTPLEKDMFSALAQRLGYKGLSDFIRSTVLRVFSSP